MEWRSEQGLDEEIDTEVGKRVTFTNTNDGNKYTGTLVQDLGNGRFTFRAKDGKVYGSEGFGSNWKIEFEASKKATPEIPSFKGTRDALDNLFESVSLFDILDENYETDPHNLNDKTDYRKVGKEAFIKGKKRNENPYSIKSPAGIDWDKGWDKAQSEESDAYKGY